MEAVLVSFAVAVVGVGAIREVLLRLKVVDVPNARSSHSRVVVRGGGLGVGLAIGAGLVLLPDRQLLHGEEGLVAALVGFGIIGFIEDVFEDRPILMRFGFQLLTAAIAARWLIVGSHVSVLEWIVAWGLVVGWLVGFVNIFNFMDGINGISGVQVVVIGLSFAALGHLFDDDPFMWLGGILAAAALGFLPWNTPAARIFLGDVGSYLLGGVTAAALVVGFRGDIPLAALAAPFLPYVADGTLTLLRRVVRGERWWEPHRQHAYQRLVDSGWDHAPTAIFVGLSSALCAAGGLAGAKWGGAAWAVGGALAAAATIGYIATARAVRRRYLLDNPDGINA